MEKIVKSFLKHIGEDPSREGLLKTPERVVESWKYLFSGYKQNPKDLFTVFENDENYDEMVILKNIEFNSFCEHHLLPFSGKASVAYIPNKKIVGISKLARLVDMYARRLQIQERMGVQITKTLMKYLKPKGAGCVIEAKHFCMVCRGVEKQHSSMITSSLEGAFKKSSLARSEFLSLIKG